MKTRGKKDASQTTLLTSPHQGNNKVAGAAHMAKETQKATTNNNFDTDGYNNAVLTKYHECVKLLQCSSTNNNNNNNNNDNNIINNNSNNEAKAVQEACQMIVLVASGFCGKLTEEYRGLNSNDYHKEMLQTWKQAKTKLADHNLKEQEVRKAFIKYDNNNMFASYHRCAYLLKYSSSNNNSNNNVREADIIEACNVILHVAASLCGKSVEDYRGPKTDDYDKELLQTWTQAKSMLNEYEYALQTQDMRMAMNDDKRKRKDVGRKLQELTAVAKKRKIAAGRLSSSGTLGDGEDKEGATSSSSNNV